MWEFKANILKGNFNERPILYSSPTFTRIVGYGIWLDEDLLSYGTIDGKPLTKDNVKVEIKTHSHSSLDVKNTDARFRTISLSEQKEMYGGTFDIGFDIIDKDNPDNKLRGYAYLKLTPHPIVYVKMQYKMPIKSGAEDKNYSSYYDVGYESGFLGNAKAPGGYTPIQQQFVNTGYEQGKQDTIGKVYYYDDKNHFNGIKTKEFSFATSLKPNEPCKSFYHYGISYKYNVEDC